MGKNKKQFIDKKKAQTFTLVHRSQRDPLKADEDSAQRVLVPNPSSKPDDEKVKYGVYYDDDYDYLQHLRTRQDGEIVTDSTLEKINENRKDDKVAFGDLLLPQEAFPSQFEEREGLLSKGVLPCGPKPDWDPDVVAALDDDLNFDDPDNLLEDDFIMKANTAGDEDEWETDDEEEGSDVSSDAAMFSDNDFTDDEEEETKSRFTSYSMTSSIIRRTEGLKILDDRFEQIMEEYDEEEIGSVDHEDINGCIDVNNDLVQQCVDEFIEKQRKHDLAEMRGSEDEDHDYSDDDDKEIPDDKLFAQFQKAPKSEWDCESIVSTYSNLYNHPKIIEEVKKTKKIELHKHTGVPIGVFKESVDEKETCEYETVVLSNIRHKGETPEKRKLRKSQVKEQRKNRRVEKKSNKLAFKDESKKQEKINANTTIQKQGIKL